MIQENNHLWTKNIIFQRMLEGELDKGVLNTLSVIKQKNNTGVDISET